jgi:hypothetical protein
MLLATFINDYELNLIQIVGCYIDVALKAL